MSDFHILQMESLFRVLAGKTKVLFMRNNYA